MKAVKPKPTTVKAARPEPAAAKPKLAAAKPKPNSAPMPSTMEDPLLDLQGASRTVGGIFRGRALGNSLNHADQDVDMYEAGSFPLVGKVFFYTDRQEGAKPSMSLKHEVVPKLSPVLVKLGRSFSPIRSMWY